MSTLILKIAVTIVGLTDLDSIETIRDAISAVWRDGSPARNHRIRCSFHLEVKQADPALGDDYFPNFSISIDQKKRSNRKSGPQTRWIEDNAVRGDLFRNVFEFQTTDGRPAPRGWKSDRFFNGRNSWVYEPSKKLALQHEGIDPTAILMLGYYEDMIGFPGKPQGIERTTAGGLGEPYQLDRILTPGRYEVRGREAVEGEECVLLERTGLDRLWLAKGRGWAIVRREWHWNSGGPIKRRIVNSGFSQFSPGAWIPSKSRMEIFGHPSSRPGKLVGVLNAEVLEAEADISEAWFEPNFPKGATVYDMVTGETYPFGMELQTLDQAVIRAARYGPAFRPAAWWMASWLRWAALIVLPLFALWLSRRLRAPR